MEQVVLGENGVIHGAQPGSFYVDVSTSSPTLIRRIHKVLGERGVKVADAPVSGGVVGAEEASLQIMVGSDPDVYEQIKPALLGIGDKITYIGEVGAGEVAKLVHNQIALVVQQAVAEGLTLGANFGISRKLLGRSVAAFRPQRRRQGSGREDSERRCRAPGTRPGLRWRWRAKISAWPPIWPASSAYPCPWPPSPSKPSSSA